MNRHHLCWAPWLAALQAPPSHGQHLTQTARHWQREQHPPATCITEPVALCQRHRPQQPNWQKRNGCSRSLSRCGAIVLEVVGDDGERRPQSPSQLQPNYSVPRCFHTRCPPLRAVDEGCRSLVPRVAIFLDFYIPWGADAFLSCESDAILGKGVLCESVPRPGFHLRLDLLIVNAFGEVRLS